MPKLRLVIESTIVRGVGTKSDPCRAVVQYHDTTGLLLAEHDPAPAQPQSFDPVVLPVTGAGILTTRDKGSA